MTALQAAEIYNPEMLKDAEARDALATYDEVVCGHNEVVSESETFPGEYMSLAEWAKSLLAMHEALLTLADATDGGYAEAIEVLKREQREHEATFGLHIARLLTGSTALDSDG